MSNPQTLHDISAELKRIGAEARDAYDAAWAARIREWEQGIFRIDIGQDGHPLPELGRRQPGSRYEDC